ALDPIVVTVPVFMPNATVTLTLSDPTVGNLTVGSSGQVTSTYNTVTGIWKASGAVADVNNLLATLKFQPTPNGNSNFSIGVSIADGWNVSLADTMAVQGVPVNDPPVLIKNTLTITQGQTVTLTSENLSATDVDDDSAALTFI